MNVPEQLKVNFWNFLKLKSSVTRSFFGIFSRFLVCILRGLYSTRGIRRIFAKCTELRLRVHAFEKSQVPFVMGFLRVFFHLK